VGGGYVNDGHVELTGHLLVQGAHPRGVRVTPASHGDVEQFARHVLTRADDQVGAVHGHALAAVRGGGVPELDLVGHVRTGQGDADRGVLATGDDLALVGDLLYDEQFTVADEVSGGVGD